MNSDPVSPPPESPPPPSGGPPKRPVITPIPRGEYEVFVVDPSNNLLEWVDEGTQGGRRYLAARAPMGGFARIADLQTGTDYYVGVTKGNGDSARLHAPNLPAAKALAEAILLEDSSISE